jgi:hypothetical protein
MVYKYHLEIVKDFIHDNKINIKRYLLASFNNLSLDIYLSRSSSIFLDALSHNTHSFTKGFQRAGVVGLFDCELTILNFCQGLLSEPFHTRSHFTTSSEAFAIYGSLHSTFAVPFHHKVHSNSITSHSFTATP